MLIVGGCAGSADSPVKLAWPPPPQPPKIEYVRSIYGSNSLPLGIFSKIKNFFFGKSPEMALGKPYGITFDGESVLYVVDTASKGVMSLNLSSGKTHFIQSMGPYGQLVEPVNLVLGSNNKIYIADTGLKKIVVFDQAGTFLQFIGEKELQTPVGLAFDQDKQRLFVTDASQHSVKVFSPDGVLLGEFGKRGDQKGEFYHPLGITVNQDNEILVVDSFHFAVQVFDMEGNYRSSFGSTTKGLGSLARPRGIAVDADNQIYVTDALKNNVQIFDAQGRSLLAFGSRGLGPGQFRLPAGICVTADDRIFVVDSINMRIQEFKYVARKSTRS